MDYASESLRLHYKWQGKLDIVNKVPVECREDLSLAYTPGVAQPCIEINKNVDLSYELTGRGNTIAVVTDGTAVLGLGDIGPEAGMPVMEGKCVLFKAFGGVNAIPLCIRSKDVDDIVKTVTLLAGSFGGINLEDISAPRCFEIEKRLKETCDIPIFHDDQHGTAVVVLAAMLNALKVVGKRIEDIKVVTSGAGAAGIAVIKLLQAMGLKNVILCDSKGAIYKGREGLNPYKREMAEISNFNMEKGTLGEVIKGADVFIGVSVLNRHGSDGAFDGEGSDTFPDGQSHTRDNARRSKTRRSGCYRYGQIRLSKSDKQRRRFPGHIQGCARCARKRYKRCDEDSRCEGDSIACFGR